MSTVSIPNQIQAGQPLDPRPVMANFDELASFINDDVLTLDGSKAMTGHLTLSGPGTAGGHAVTKAQLDDALGSDVAGGGFLPLAGGTVTGDLQVNGRMLVNKGSGAAPGLAFRTGDSQQSTGLFYHADYLGLVRDGDTKVLVYPDQVRVKDADLQVDGQILASRGTVAEPGLSFAAYKGTGLYPGTTYLGTHINGKMRFYVYEDRTRVFDDLQVDTNLRVSGLIHATGTVANERDAPANVHINDSGYLYKTKVGSLPLSGGTVTGDLKVDGNLQLVGTVTGDLQIGAYSSGLSAKVRWTVGNAAIYGQDGGSWKGMRFLVNGTAELDLYDAEYPSLFHRGLRIKQDLKVEGQTLAQNGTKAKPAYSFTNDPDTGFYLYGTGIATIACAGKNVANFGTAGVAFPEGLATITGTAANLYISPVDGQLYRITDVKQAPTVADINRLETLVEKLSARIDMLEGQKGL